MKDYRNMSCAACGVVFDEHSDIVICPECGAPHHRECWKENGHCACESQHSEQYEWQPQKASDSVSSAGNDGSASRENNREMIKCPVCGGETPKSEDYCEKCGYYLAHSREGAYERPVSESDFSKLFDIDESEPIDGVPVGDVKKFVGNMWMYYIPRFLSMVKKKSSVSFNFTAFFTNGLWFISRKMYGWGVVLLILMMLITGYQTYYYNVFNSTLGSLASEITPFQLMRDYKLLFGGLMLNYFLTLLQNVMMLLCGIFGNKLYMNFCTRKIKKINAEATAAHSTPEQFNEKVESTGGVTALYAVCAGLCYFAVLYVLKSGLLF